MFMDPTTLLSLCNIRSTDNIADFGAGSGFVARAAAKLVPHGNVFAIEIHRDIISRLTRDATDWGIRNIHPLWGDIEIKGGTKLDDTSMDFVILSNVLFNLDDKEACITEAKRVLKPEGRMLVVDWADSFKGMGPQPHQIFSKEQTKSLSLRLGFEVLNENLPAGDHHYAILFKKTKS